MTRCFLACVAARTSKQLSKRSSKLNSQYIKHEMALEMKGSHPFAKHTCIVRSLIAFKGFCGRRDCRSVAMTSPHRCQRPSSPRPLSLPLTWRKAITPGCSQLEKDVGDAIIMHAAFSPALTILEQASSVPSALLLPIPFPAQSPSSNPCRKESIHSCICHARCRRRRRPIRMGGCEGRRFLRGGLEL